MKLRCLNLVCVIIFLQGWLFILDDEKKGSSWRKQEINAWAERCIVDVRRIDMDLGKAGYVLEIRFPTICRRGKVDDPVMMPS